MTDEEFLLHDRITKIQSVIKQYGEENFYLSFSGGKDSTVMSGLVDMALPGNCIPRVYVNTGIEFQMIRDFVIRTQETDGRIKIITPDVPIRQMLGEVGYPFKSKTHSKIASLYRRRGRTMTVQKYLGEDPGTHWSPQQSCPKILRYQFTPEFSEKGLKISDKCCARLKEKPLEKWKKENGRKIAMVGLMREEGGRRFHANCLSFRENKLRSFQPLVAVSKSWEDWFIKTYGVEIAELYLEPYLFLRTGCKGCPYAIKLQKELDILETYFPNERKQCEAIWAPVYAEYRRIGYRLKDGGKKNNE